MAAEPNIFTLPSGLGIELRGLRGREGELLASREAARNGTLFDQILDGCTLQVHDEGPYRLNGLKPAWDRVLVGDKMDAMLKVRGITYDDCYPFKLQCQNPVCRESFEWQVLLSELERRTLSEEDRTTFQNGNRFPGTFQSDGKPFTFKLITGADTQKMLKVTGGGKQAQLLASLMARIVEVTDVHPNDRKKFLMERPLGDLNGAIQDMDTHDCGVETDFEVECTHCGHLQETRLPLDREFWLPSKEARTKMETAKAARKASAAQVTPEPPSPASQVGGTPALI